MGNLLAAFYFYDASKYFPRMKYNKIGKSFEYAKKRYIPLLETQILLFVVSVSFFFIFGGFTLFAFFDVFPMSYVIGIIPGIIALLLISFFLFLSPIVCVVEKKSPMDSLKGSMKVIKKNKANTFIVLLLIFVISLSISVIGSLPSSIYSFYTTGITTISIVLTAFELLFGTYAGLFSYSAQVNYYLSIKKKTKKKK